MDQTEAPLYPKLPTIYNKIMQLGLGILLLVGVLAVWLFGRLQVDEHIEQHYAQASRIYTEQVAQAVSVMADAKQSELINRYFTQLESLPLVHHVRYYDVEGAMLWQSDNSADIRDNGIANEGQGMSAAKLVFVEEVRGDKLQGYVRLSLDQQMMAEEAKVSADTHYAYFRLLLVIAGFIGFLFARGIRFRVARLREEHSL